MADMFSNTIELAVYTNHVLVQGSVALPYRRVIDLLNSEDREYISIDRATVTPLALTNQVTGPNSNPTVLHRRQVVLAGLTSEQSAPLPDDTTAQRSVRTPCLGFVGPFVFHGHVQMLRGQRLLDMLETQHSDFLLFYDVAIYLIDRPDVPAHPHAGLIVNQRMLDVLYLL
jgi:hypothetical protein